MDQTEDEIRAQQKNMSAENEQKPKKPSILEQTPQTYLQIERGIYRYKDVEGETTYHERVEIGGKRTKRALGFNFTPQKSIALARTEYHRRRTEVAAGRNPYAEAEEEGSDETRAVELTIPGVLTLYRDAGYPDKYLRKRQGRMLEIETRHCESLLEYWDEEPWDSLTPKLWRKYHNWRVKRVPGYQDPNKQKGTEVNDDGVLETAETSGKPKQESCADWHCVVPRDGR
jgi:hypothetical protein